MKEEFVIVADLGNNPILCRYILECPYETRSENQRYGYYEAIRRFEDDFPFAEEYAVVRYDEDIPFRLIEPFNEDVQAYFNQHQIIHWAPRS